MSASPAAPLTHHEILGLVEPFTRSGRHLDLAATDRAQRRLVFKPVERPGASSGDPVLRESLALESLGTGTFRLTRTLTHASGLQATLQALGEQPGELLGRVDGVLPQRQFRSVGSGVIARSYVVPWTSNAAPAGTVSPVLTRGVAQLDGLTMTLVVSEVRGVAADLTLVAAPDELALPQDLLAVLGWNWTRLVRSKEGWKSKLRLRGAAARRTASAEDALDQAAAHLSQTLAEAPGRFHDRHAAARRWVVFRRAIPLLTPLLLVATILLLPRFDTGENPGMWLLLYHVPTVLIVLSFCVQELPQFEIPPWPRRSAALSWRQTRPPPARSAAAPRGLGSG